MQLWGDFDIRGSDYPLSTNATTFLANNYQVISLEKCLGSANSDGTYNTEAAFVDMAETLRNHASDESNENLKIVFYWNTFICYCDCYNCTKSVYANESMWFKDDDGEAIYADSAGKRPYLDQTQEYVREWWVNSVVDVIQAARARNISVNGIFADGLCPYIVYKGVSTTRNNEFVLGVRKLMQLATERLKAIDEDMLILANGIKHYSIYEEYDYCRDSLNYTDGAIIEHFAAFEEVDTSTSTINSDYLLSWVNIIYNETNYNNKSIFIKSWMGPEISPGPSWPDSYKYPTPKNNSDIQKHAQELLQFPLAVYLCGLLTHRYIYFSYAWYWGVSQGYYPCYENNECATPADGWYDEFLNQLGRPVSEPNWIINDSVKLCTRSFEYVNVTVDLNNQESGTIIWNIDNTIDETTLAPSISPSMSPSMIPTMSPSKQPTRNQGFVTNVPTTTSGSGVNSTDGDVNVNTQETNGLQTTMTAQQGKGNNDNNGKHGLSDAVIGIIVAVVIVVVGVGICSMLYFSKHKQCLWKEKSEPLLVKDDDDHGHFTAL